MKWLKTRLIKIMLWCMGFPTDNPCQLCRSFCKHKKELCNFYEPISSEYSPTLMNIIKKIIWNIKTDLEYREIDGMDVFISIWIIVAILMLVWYISECIITFL